MSFLRKPSVIFAGIGAVGLVAASQYYKREPAQRGTLGLTPLPKDTSVVFVLGGPGAGKGTQCSNIVKDYGFVHLSAGDLLREERQRKGSPYGELINNYIKEGQIVPMEITISLLHAAMKANGGNRFLVDGFPRAIDQGQKFEEEVVKAKMVLYYECPEEEMLKRLMRRGETSGRVDDNIESIKKRFVTFRDTSYPVIEMYKDKVEKVSCMNTVEGVYNETKKIFDKHFPTK
ncbi:adenylate kinase-domain-containing protein [Chytriomyces sp. MP71]|nr:adenylate kinase-domain-containing protein [Chytriomyces sp. MP71]